MHGGAGMGAQRAACNVAFRAEHAALSKEICGQSLVDIVKALKKVPHAALIKGCSSFTSRLMLTDVLVP